MSQNLRLSERPVYEDTAEKIGKFEVVEQDGSSSDANEAQSSTLEAERRLVLKCDLHLIPILFTVFVFAFMDRINIGNARIQGLEKDLNMTGNQYNIALFTFFPLYIFFEVPSNIILKKVPPSLWLSGLMLAWGIITICLGFTQTYGGLIACRVLLGLFEAGFFPGSFYLISMYYKRYELQWRATLFFSASILAGAFAGLLAFAIAKMDGIRGYSGWRWIFIIEGVATVLIAVASGFLIPDWPEQAKFLSAEEKALLKRRLEEDAGGAKMNKMSRKDFLHVCMDWKIWAGTIQYLGIVCTSYSGVFFLPTILKELGWTAVRAQVMSIPVYIVATALSLTSAALADRTRHRSSFVLLGIVIAMVGYALLLGQRSLNEQVKYFATYLIIGGGYVAQPMCMGWLTNQMGGHYKRSVATAMQVGIGNLGGIIASNIYLPTQAPSYPLGYGVGMGLMGMAALGVAWMLIGVVLENKRRDRGERDWRLELPQEQRENLGDDHPHFRYTY